MKPRCALVNFARSIPARLLAGLVFVAAMEPGQPAQAYLDPGTGGFILQMLLGGFAGALVVGKLYWQRFSAIFRRTSKNDAALGESQPTSDPPAE